MVRSKADMLANLDSHAEQVVDAREEGRFTGKTPDFRPGVPSGHIPGSVNLPFTELYNKDGTFKDKAGLQARVRAGRGRSLEAGRHHLRRRRDCGGAELRAAPARQGLRRCAL